MLKSIKFFLAEHKYFFLVLIIYCFLQYIFFYTGGKIILGGEGNYWIDWEIYFQKSGWTWLDSTTGLIATSLNSFFSFPALFLLLNHFPLSFKSFLFVASVFILPFSGMYLLLKNLDPSKNNKRALLLSLFFVVNPFTLLFLNALLPWLNHSLFIFPLYFLILLRYYQNNFKLFSIFGIVSFLLAYTNANPPLMVLISISPLIFIFLIQIIKFNKILGRAYFKKILTVYSSFVIFNIWWIIHWLIALPYANKIYTMDFAKSWLLYASSRSKMSMMGEIFSLTWQVPKILDYNFFSFYYNLPYIKLLLLIPFLIILYWFLAKDKSSKNKKIIYSLAGFLVFIILFLKGHNPPFQNLLLNCFNYVPFCHVFKTPAEKFGALFIFLFTLTLFFVLKNIKNKWINYLFYFYLIICLIPFITGKFIPDYKIEENKYGSREYIDLPEFQEFREEMRKKKLDYRILSLPTGGNYQIAMHMYNDKYYTGLDPLLNNIPQVFIADYSDERFKDLFLKLNSKIHEKLLAIYSIKNIHFNKRLLPWFGNLAGKTIPEQEEILNQKYQKKHEYGEMILYNNPSFLPHFYTPQTIITTNQDLEDLPLIISQEGYKIRSAIYFAEQNKDKLEMLKSLPQDFKNTPILEFKKINPTKYRIVVHKAKDNFLLVFSESFHNRWRSYVLKSPISKVKNQSLDHYRILKGNEEDQASKEMVKEFINNGWVSSLKGERGKIWKRSVEDQINFISRNFEGTIQNDNLPRGPIWETWFRKNALPIAEKEHLLANGYANSWMINPGEICRPSDQCRKNPDGSYDLELVVEFWPQRIFYLTIMLNSIALLGSILYLLSDLIYKKIKTHRPNKLCISSKN